MSIERSYDTKSVPDKPIGTLRPNSSEHSPHPLAQK